MADEIGGLDRLPERLRDKSGAYARLVRQLAGADAAALAFYGLVVSGNFDPSSQPARNVLVLENVKLEMLRDLGQQGIRYAKAGIAAPVIMTPEYISRSRDTFPLELMEIQQQHVLLFGKDFFSELSFDESHVRMQCERELKTAQLTMLEGLLGTGGRERLLHEVVADLAEGLVRVLRGLVWMKGVREPRSTTETVQELEKATSRKLPGIWAALDATQRHDWGAYQLLYADVSALGSMVDGW